MNWDQIAGSWKEMKGRAKEKWGELTNDDLDRIEGQHDQMVGLLQRKYGYAKEKAVQEIDSWTRGL